MRTRLTEILTTRLSGTPGGELAGELARTVAAIVTLAEARGRPTADEIAEGRAREKAVQADTSKGPRER